MNKKSKFLSVLIILTLALSIILSACAADDDKKDGGTTTEAQGNDINGEESNEPTDPRDIPDGLAPDDFGSAEFRILFRNSCQRGNWASHEPHRMEIIPSEEMDGEIINDAIASRNRTVEERFNVKIVGIAHPAHSQNESDVVAYAQRSIQSNSDDFDMVVSWTTGIANLASQGYLANWNSIPNIDLSKPWWVKNAMDTFTIDGKTFMAMSDIVFSGVVGDSAFILFNQNLLQDFNLESPYKMVEENRWTIDVLHDLVRDCYSDTNGDNLRDFEDTYGFTSDAWGSAYAWMWALGNHATTKDPQTGLPYYDIFSERNVTSINKVHDLFYNNDGSAITNAQGNSIDFKGRGDQATLFSAGNALFMLDRVGVLLTPEFRNASFEYGILPIPKFDTAQEKYLTMVNAHGSAMGIPVYNDKLEMTGKVIEALSAESYKQFVPAYYEVSLKTKFSRDEESVRMLDLIVNGIVFDFALLYNLPMHNLYEEILCNKRDPGTFTSTIERGITAAENRLQAILDLYDDIDD